MYWWCNHAEVQCRRRRITASLKFYNLFFPRKHAHNFATMMMRLPTTTTTTTPLLAAIILFTSSLLCVVSPFSTSPRPFSLSPSRKGGPAPPQLAGISSSSDGTDSDGSGSHAGGAGKNLKDLLPTPRKRTLILDKFGRRVHDLTDDGTARYEMKESSGGAGGGGGGSNATAMR